MGLRETLNKKKSVSVGIAAILLLCAISFLVYTQWPDRGPKGDKAFYTVDDGQTWFLDSVYKTPPFDYQGKTAFRAMVYSYDNGKKTFCPFVQRYNANTKKQLDDAIAQATHDGKPLSSIGLFSSPGTLAGVDVKLSGAGHSWVPRSNIAEASKVLDVQAPDGSAVDFVIPY